MTPPSALPPGAASRKNLRTHARTAARLGWKGWLILVRRAAPYLLLILALVQLKALTDRVKQVENRDHWKKD